MDAQELRADLAHYTGCDQPFRHRFARNVLYTDGVQFFAKNAGGGAYWLIDILATQPEILKGVKEHGMCVAVLNVQGRKARLTVARDYTAKHDKHGIDVGGTFENVTYSRAIDLTDCPEGVWKFYFIDNMIMLPSEY